MHLYDKEGKPVYEVPYSNPKKGMRKTNLRDARKLSLVPSVTSVLDILDKPGLNIWLQDRVLESALTMTRNEDETDKVFIARIKKDSKETSLLARDKGSAIHDALESVFKGRVVTKEYRGIANKVHGDVITHFGQDDFWEAEQSFSHEIGYGGKVDLNNKEINVVLDFKTKEIMKDKMAFDDQCTQLAAYCEGLKMPDARLVNVFVGYDGKTVFHEWKNEEKERCWNMFKACLELWKLQKRYNPSF